jgi:hypothetical protein
VATVGITITKEAAFRDSVQPFSNQYFYDNGVLNHPTLTEAEALLDALVTLEKTFHSTMVTFKYGRLWSQIGVAALNNMLVQKALSGVGSTSQDAAMDRERAFLFRWRAGQDSRGNPVYLRKYYHSMGQFPGSGVISAAIHGNTTGFTDTQRSTMAGNANGIKNITAAGIAWQLCAKSGRDIDSGQAATCHRYLEHHQLGDAWRAT